MDQWLTFLQFLLLFSSYFVLQHLKLLLSLLELPLQKCKTTARVPAKTKLAYQTSIRVDNVDGPISQYDAFRTNGPEEKQTDVNSSNSLWARKLGGWEVSVLQVSKLGCWEVSVARSKRSWKVNVLTTYSSLHDSNSSRFCPLKSRPQWSFHSSSVSLVNSWHKKHNPISTSCDCYTNRPKDCSMETLMISVSYLPILWVVL